MIPGLILVLVSVVDCYHGFHQNVTIPLVIRKILIDILVVSVRVLANPVNYT